MKSQRVAASTKTIFYFIVFSAILIACDNQQGMMHGGSGTMYNGNWNWIVILIGVAIVFLIGYLVARRRK
jgi:hypothetical protein